MSPTPPSAMARPPRRAQDDAADLEAGFETILAGGVNRQQQPRVAGRGRTVRRVDGAVVPEGGRPER